MDDGDITTLAGNPNKHRAKTNKHRAKTNKHRAKTNKQGAKVKDTAFINYKAEEALKRKIEKLAENDFDEEVQDFLEEEATNLIEYQKLFNDNEL